MSIVRDLISPTKGSNDTRTQDFGINTLPNYLTTEGQTFTTSNDFLKLFVNDSSHGSSWLILSDKTNPKIDIESLFDEKSTELSSILDILGFELSIIDYSFQLLKLLKRTNKAFEISRTSENELLFYFLKNGTYHNLMLDEDGDLEIMIIPENRSKSCNRIFYKDDINDMSVIVDSFFNGL